MQVVSGCREAKGGGAWPLEELKKAEELGCKVFLKPYDMKKISEWLDEQEKNISPERKLAELKDEH